MGQFIEEESEYSFQQDNPETVDGGSGRTKQFGDKYGNELRVFDADCLKGIETLEIGDDCFKKVSVFVLEGLHDLRSVSIGINSFYLNKKNRNGSKCVIRSCDCLREITIGLNSFYCYESLVLKDLPSLLFTNLWPVSFPWCSSVVFESENRVIIDEILIILCT